MLHDQLNMIELLEHGTRIELDVHGTMVKGKIVGCAQLDVSRLGPMYIIEPDQWIKDLVEDSSYKYSHFVAFRNQFQVLEG